MLRRQSIRALRVFELHKQDDPAIAMFESTLIPTAKAYIESYAAVQASGATKNFEIGEGRTRTEALYQRIRVWLGTVSRDIPGFNAEEPLDVTMPDQVIGYAESLIGLVSKHAERLPFAAKFIEDVGGAFELAKAEWAQAQEALTKLQNLRADLRDRAVQVNRELVAFRRTLRNTLGSSHRSYQQLRSSRVFDAEVTDDAVIVEDAVSEEPTTVPAPSTAVAEPAVVST